MNDLEKKLNQCKKPSGKMGKQVVEEMNKHHFHLTSWGLEKVHIEENSIILDIGCGGGSTVARLASMAVGGKVYGIDYSPDCVNWSKAHNKQLISKGRVEILHAGVEKMPFEENQFDIVMAVETVYFWPGLVKCFQEVRRVLKSSGKFVIVNEMYVNEAFKERNDKFTAAGEMILHTPEKLKELLEKAGFKSVTIDLMEEKNWLCCVSEK
ncbi:class I SAM-dependent methyltransferase [Candidatus Contubernalis alkaliaceticus]|uniref:class I SAM-dependent methyltransferase n=1 Tax=Candidatus Contubernalis alkaliaceticus TaxID=338645 RepID=UPI001F4C1BD5|nr:class I SAM-dependent methyltransferase [Candidatus Contubernalis alkalaceticus]UNC90983.1 class I SAM-dependent methyltransferase [Candidatus Contubernalis alkalaceticus]